MMMLHPERERAIVEKYGDGAHAFTPVRFEDGKFGLGVVKANVRGIETIDASIFSTSTFEIASAEADRINLDVLMLRSETIAAIFLYGIGSNTFFPWPSRYGI